MNTPNSNGLGRARDASSTSSDLNWALEAWILSTAPDAVAYAASLLRDRTAAEDVVQDCYCRLLKKAHVYDLPRDGRKLLFQSVTNACINVTTRTKPMLSLDTFPEGKNARREEQEGLHGQIADPQSHPAEVLAMQRELEEAIGEGLGQLPVNQRAALELKSLGHSLQEIGEALQVSANHAGVLVHRARQALAQHLAPYLEDLEDQAG